MKLIARSGGSCPSNEPEALTVRDSWRTSFVTALLVVAIQSVICLSQSAFARAADISRVQSQAEHGSVAQEIELGAAYLAGRGVPRDEKKAAYWYEKAANAGDPGAQQQIGYFYANGIGVDRDPERGARWFERAVALPFAVEVGCEKFAHGGKIRSRNVIARRSRKGSRKQVRLRVPGERADCSTGPSKL